MNFRVMWDTGDRYDIRAVFAEGWTWDDMRNARIACAALLHGARRSVGLIVELPATEDPPQHVIPRIVRMFSLDRERVHTVVVTCADHFTVLTTEGLQQVSNIDSVTDTLRLPARTPQS